MSFLSIYLIKSYRFDLAMAAITGCGLQYNLVTEVIKN